MPSNTSDVIKEATKSKIALSKTIACLDVGRGVVVGRQADSGDLNIKGTNHSNLRLQYIKCIAQDLLGAWSFHHENKIMHRAICMDNRIKSTYSM